MNQLNSIDIENLNYGKTGIRIKALKEAGYQTIGDVYCATLSNIASVYGISADSARLIKNLAKEAAEKIQRDIKLKISADERTEEASQLIVLLSQYKDKIYLQEKLDKLLLEESKEIEIYTEKITQLNSYANWLFSEKSERVSYIQAYKILTVKKESDYFKRAEQATANADKISYFTTAQAWDDFIKDPVIYYNILEDIVPGVLGNDDALYGLPEDLAREIQEQTFFPQGLKVTLRRYQEWGVKYILHQERVLLGDEMGLGKTIQAIATMVSLRNTGATHFLVVCPASVLPNWCKEIDKKSEFHSTKIHGNNRQLAFDDWYKNGGVGVTTYETIHALTLPSTFAFDLLIVDEAHYIKNIDARRSREVIKVSKKAERLLFMTGTALENNVGEMISLINVLNPQMASNVKGVAFLSSAEQFRQKIAPVYYRRKREDVLTELPDLEELESWCELLPEEESMYEDAVLNKRQSEIRRVSWTNEDLNKSSKALRLKEIVEEAESEGRKIIVFSFYLDTIRKIQQFLGERCTQPINGSVPVQRRQEIIEEFDEMKAGSVLLAQIQAGGTGLNIQSASVVIICEPQLKPSIEDQAISRAYRMGQTRKVLVYRLLCVNTIDEKITDLLAQKKIVFDAFADKSIAAEATVKEENQIDDKTFGKLIQEEIDRINLKKTAKED